MKLVRCILSGEMFIDNSPCKWIPKEYDVRMLSYSFPSCNTFLFWFEPKQDWSWQQISGCEEFPFLTCPVPA